MRNHTKKTILFTAAVLILALGLCACGKKAETVSADYLPDEYLEGDMGTSQVIFEDGELSYSCVLVTLDGQGTTLTYKDGGLTVTEAEEGETYDSVGMTGQQYVTFVEAVRSYVAKNEDLSSYSIYVIGIPEMLSQAVTLDSDVLFYSIADGKVTSGTYTAQKAQEAIAAGGHYGEIGTDSPDDPIVLIVQ